MNHKTSVKLLHNPIIRVTAWTTISYHNTKQNTKTPILHIKEFSTLKNTIDFPLLGNPTNLFNSGKISKTTSDSFEKNGVLIPGINVSNLVSKIMKDMSNHFMSDSDIFPSKEDTKSFLPRAQRMESDIRYKNIL